MKYTFEVSERGTIHLIVRNDQDEVLRDIPEAVRMSEVCRRLKRSRRHVYRYVRQGWLKPAARFSGELFFDASDLMALEHQAPLVRRRVIPKRFAPLFPEYDFKTLELRRDSDMILSRILERGDTHEILWAVRCFPLAQRRAFLSRQGHRLLSDRTFHFWSWLWGPISPATSPPWRKTGLPWGGAA